MVSTRRSFCRPPNFQILESLRKVVPVFFYPSCLVILVEIDAEGNVPRAQTGLIQIWLPIYLYDMVLKYEGTQSATQNTPHLIFSKNQKYQVPPDFPLTKLDITVFVNFISPSNSNCDFPVGSIPLALFFFRQGSSNFFCMKKSTQFPLK